MKEIDMYRMEITEYETKLQQIGGEGSDNSYELKKLSELLDESVGAFRDTELRLSKTMNELEVLVSQSSERDDLTIEANGLLQQAKQLIHS
jgi:cell fate (sporulation/competence/biofilm development) regulator YlbF (YheA/YmcA/DUF963 family)